MNAQRSGVWWSGLTWDRGRPARNVEDAGGTPALPGGSNSNGLGTSRSTSSIQIRWI
jgi:hypothetical protein